MAQATNNFTIVGRAVKKPDLGKTSTDKEYAFLTVAVNGIKKGTADFISLILWDSQAVNTNKYVNKGDLVAVSGHISTQNEGGKTAIKLVGDNVSFISSASKKAETKEAPKVAAPKAEPAPELDPAADFYAPITDVPFGL